MRNFAVLLLCWSFTTLAQGLASQELVDQYVQLAITADAQTLAGSERGARFSCQFPLLQNPELKAWGKDMKEASNRLQLLCIKEECARLGAKVNRAASELRDLPASELDDFLEFSGMEEAEREQTIASRGNYDERTAPVHNCATGSPTFRTVAFTLCFATPVECSSLKRRR